MTRILPLGLLIPVLLAVDTGCCCLSQLCCLSLCDVTCDGPCDSFCADGGACDGLCGEECLDSSCACGSDACGGDCCGEPCCEPCAGSGECFPLLRRFVGSLGMCFGCGASGCGEVYWNGYYNDPPDPFDPCDGCGNWVGSCGPYRAPYRDGPYLAGEDPPYLVGEGGVIDDSAILQAPPEPVLEPTPAPLPSARRPQHRPIRHW